MPLSRLPLIIDDTSIRKGLFKTAAEILKKIEKLELERESFHEKDQALFRDWYNVTFKTELQRAERLYKEYEDLAHFHNSVLAQAEMNDQSLHEALASLRREQKQYDKGTEAQKKKIEAERLKREEFLEKVMKEPEEPLETEAQKQKRQRKESFYFFEALLDAINAREGYKILSMWESATPAMRQEAEESFLELRGVSLTDFIEKLAHQKEKLERPRKSKNLPNDPPAPSPTSSDIKVLYRKLARRLHPDVAKGVNKKITAAWIQQVWLKVQEAYKNQDVESLQRLDLSTLIRMDDLSSLSLDEIRASQAALAREFQDLRFSIKDLKKHPAWKFSSKKSFETLKRKIKDQLRRDLEPLKYDVERLREIYGNRSRRD